jgi:hypothetical protein
VIDGLASRFEEVAGVVAIEISQQASIRHRLPDRSDEKRFEPRFEAVGGRI